MSRLRLIAAFSLSCGLIAACGGSTPRPPSYVAAGNATCAAQLAQLKKLAQPTTPEQAVSYLPHALRVMRREAGELATLRPSAAARPELADALSEMHQLSGVLTSFLHQLRAGVVELATFAHVQQQSDALRSQLDAHLRRAGLTQCAM